MNTLIVSSVGTVLERVEYQYVLSSTEQAPAPFVARSGAAAATHWLASASSEIDVLLLTTHGTDTSTPKEITTDTRVTDSVSAAALVAHEIRTAASQTHVRIARHRLDWDKNGADVKDTLAKVVGLPATVVNTLQQQFGTTLSHYALIAVDIAAGLRPIGLGLWLCLEWMRAQLGESESHRIRSFYAEKDTTEPTPFQFDVKTNRKSTTKVDGRSAGWEPAHTEAKGRFVEVTELANGAHLIAATHAIVRNLDFRSALRRIRRDLPDPPAGKPVPPDPLLLFADYVQAGLDLDASIQAVASDKTPLSSAPRPTDPLSQLLLAHIQQSASEWKPSQNVLNRAARKTLRRVHYELDQDELQRHELVVDRLLQAGRLSDASLHMRELFLTMLQHAQKQPPTLWLARRRNDERLLNALSHLSENFDSVYPKLSLNARLRRDLNDSEIQLLRDVRELTLRIRNPLAHAARAADDGPKDIGASLADIWNRRRPSAPDGALWPQQALNLVQRTGQSVLVTALPFGPSYQLGAALRAWNTTRSAGSVIVLATHTARHTDGTDHWINEALKASESALMKRSEVTVEAILSVERDRKRFTAVPPTVQPALDPSAPQCIVATLPSEVQPPMQQPASPTQSDVPRIASATTVAQALLHALVGIMAPAETVVLSDSGGGPFQRQVIRAIGELAEQEGAQLEFWSIGRDGPRAPDDQTMNWATYPVTIVKESKGHAQILMLDR